MTHTLPGRVTKPPTQNPVVLRHAIPLETYRTLTLLLRPAATAARGTNPDGAHYSTWLHEAPFRLPCYLYDAAACEQVGHHLTVRAVLMYRKRLRGLPEHYLDLFPTDERAHFNLHCVRTRTSVPRSGAVVPFVVDMPQGGVIYLTPRRQ